MLFKEKIVTFSETRREILKIISKNDHLPDDVREGLADIIQVKVKEIVDFFPVGPRAIIWSGGFSRGEATYTQGKLLNDVDLFVFGYFTPRLLQVKNLEEWKNLTGGRVKISISIGVPAYLRKYKTLTNYELTAGAVIYGDKRIKEKIKANSNNLSKFEGLRELFTRLLALQNLDRTDLELNHLAAKTYIACSDCYLLLHNEYIPSYLERRKRIENLDMPKELKEKARRAYEFKISKREKVDFSLSDAKKVLLDSIQYYLWCYVGEEKNSIHTLKILEEKFPKNIKNILLNLFYYWQLRKKHNPKFFNIVFKFNIIKLYLALFYYEQGDYKMVKKILSEFVKEEEADNLPEIFALYPNPSTIELF